MAVAAGMDHPPRRRPRLVYIETNGNPDLLNQNTEETSQENKYPHTTLNWKQIIAETSQNNSKTIIISILCLIIYRLIIGRSIESFFDPDEYWQSMEVAHKITFGYGHLTWEWEQKIRSYLHPMIFALLYSTIKFLKIDSPWMIQWSPRLLQSIILVFQDIGVYLLALRIYSKHKSRKTIAILSLLFQISLWFNSYCGVRTYSNCIETCLILWGLLFFPLPETQNFSFQKTQQQQQQMPSVTKKYIIISLFLAGFSVAIRPTAGIFWFSISLEVLIRCKKNRLFFLLSCVFMGLFWILILLITDRIMYGVWVFVPFQFLKFNVLRGVGNYYGVHPFHWYFSNALPVVLFTFLPVFIFGAFLLVKKLFFTKNFNNSHEFTLLSLIFNYIIIFSCLGHKEFRFLFPIVPLIMVICGYGCFSFLKNEQYSKKSFFNFDFKSKIKILFISFLILANFPMLIYFSIGHQVGTTHVMESIQNDNSVDSVYFLLPCHQTPYYSFIHRNISLDFPDCSPPVGKDSSLVGYKTENSEFLRDPLEFVSILFDENRNNLPPPLWLSKNSVLPKKFPSHFVTYSKIADKLDGFFVKHGYQICNSFFHSFTPLDDIQSDVLLFCKSL